MITARVHLARIERTARSSSLSAFQRAEMARATSAIDGFSTPLSMSPLFTASLCTLEYAMYAEIFFGNAMTSRRTRETK